MDYYADIMSGISTLQSEISIVGVIQTLIVLAISALFARETRRRAKREIEQEKRSKLRAKESQLAMKMLFASLKLSMITAENQKLNNFNGKLDDAMQDGKEAKAEYNDFVNTVFKEQLEKE